MLVFGGVDLLLLELVDLFRHEFDVVISNVLFVPIELFLFRL